MPFYESLRTALSRYAAFVHTAGSAASAAEIRAASARLPWPLPPSYADFLSSWNGVTLFHEALVLYAASALRPTGPADRFVCIGAASDGELWLDQRGRLRLISETAPDPMVCGSDIGHWLDATLARETLIFDREGEFRDVFEEDGEALSSAVRRKRALVGAKHDADAALYPYEQAELLCEESDLDGARLLLQKAETLDSEAGPAWELLSGLLQKLGQLPAAEHAALQAAAATWDPYLRAARLLDAAELLPERAGDHAAAAAAADPEHGQELIDQARELLEKDGDQVEAQRVVKRVQLLLAHSKGLAKAEAELSRLERELRTRGALRIL